MNIHTLTSEMADLLGQLVERHPDRMIIRFDRATLRNVLAQFKDLLASLIHHE